MHTLLVKVGVASKEEGKKVLDLRLKVDRGGQIHLGMSNKTKPNHYDAIHVFEAPKFSFALC